MPMISIKLKRNEDGTRTLDPSDPMSELMLAALKGDAIGQINNLLNPEGDDMPTTYGKLTGTAGYQVPDMPDEDSPNETMDANQTKERGQDPKRPGIVGLAPRFTAEEMASMEGRNEQHMRRQALEMASKSTSGTAADVIAAAQAYYDFLAGNVTTHTIAAPPENG